MSNFLRITGSSGAGKTTFSKKLVKELILQGFLPAFYKHSSHKHFFDSKGKDTAELFQAGAGFTMIASDSATMLHQKKAFSLDAIPLEPAFDLLLLEGWKSGKGPMVYCLKEGEDLPELGPDLLLVQVKNKVEQKRLQDQGVATSIITWETEIKEAVTQLLPALINYQNKAHPLQIAVMAGGYSTRMGREKANLDFGRGPNLLALENFLTKLTNGGLYLSQRGEQDFKVKGYKIVADQFLNVGPLGGILSLFGQSPNSAWLVVAADLSKIDAEIIQGLIAQRNPVKLATVIQTDRLEPLAAIYEPAILPHLQKLLFSPHQGLTKLLRNLPIAKVELPEVSWSKLENINRPEDC